MLKCKYCNSTDIEVRPVDNIHKHEIHCKSCDKTIDWGTDLREIAPNGTYSGIITKAEEIEEKFILISVEITKYRPIKHKIWRGITGKYDKVTFLKLSKEINSLPSFLESLIGKEVKIKKQNKNTFLL